MTQATDKLESWVTGTVAKRLPDALRALSYLLEAGLRKGECSAADIPDGVTFTQPNAIGATFKLLPGCGFRKDTTRWIKMTAARKNGRIVPTWVLDQHWKAQRVLARLRAILLGKGPATQTELF